MRCTYTQTNIHTHTTIILIQNCISVSRKYLTVQSVLQKCERSVLTEVKEADCFPLLSYTTSPPRTSFICISDVGGFFLSVSFSPNLEMKQSPNSSELADRILLGMPWSSNLNTHSFYSTVMLDANVKPPSGCPRTLTLHLLH